jgi:hypothetical protein
MAITDPITHPLRTDNLHCRIRRSNEAYGAFTTNM